MKTARRKSHHRLLLLLFVMKFNFNDEVQCSVYRAKRGEDKETYRANKRSFSLIEQHKSHCSEEMCSEEIREFSFVLEGKLRLILRQFKRLYDNNSASTFKGFSFDSPSNKQEKKLKRWLHWYLTFLENHSSPDSRHSFERLFIFLFHFASSFALLFFLLSLWKD